MGTRTRSLPSKAKFHTSHNCLSMWVLCMSSQGSHGSFSLSPSLLPLPFKKTRSPVVQTGLELTVGEEDLESLLPLLPSPKWWVTCVRSAGHCRLSLRARQALDGWSGLLSRPALWLTLLVVLFIFSHRDTMACPAPHWPSGPRLDSPTWL